jgi:hypothetical protein
MAFKRWWLVMVIFLGVGIVTPILGQSDLVFIGNDLSMTEMNTALMKDVFKARYALWPNGKSITVCLPGSKSVHAEKVAQEIYGKSIQDVQKFWLSVVFQGKAKSPHFFDSEKEMSDFIAKTPGAIGVITKSGGFTAPKSQLIKINP